MGNRYPALKRQKIPYETVNTDALVGSLMLIAETRPLIDKYLGSPLELKLLRKAKVRAITYSNQIEGNPLGETEVTAVLQGKRVRGSSKDVREVQNYLSALDYVERLAEDDRPIKISDMCDIQRLVTQGTIPERQCGKIRSIPVSIVNAASGKTIEVCPEPHLLNELLEDLWRWLADAGGINPFVRSFAFHFIAISIHPFADGNGRTMRLMQHLLLLRGGQGIARFVPSETAIMQSRDRYYSVIRQSRVLGKTHPMLEYLAECFAASAQEVVAEGKKQIRDSAAKSPEARHRKILERAKKVEDFSMNDVAGWLSEIPRRTLERDLSTLVRQKMLKAQGQLKARRYSIGKQARL